MTSSEKNEIVAEVLEYLRSNAVKITDLPAETSLPSGSYVELSGGKRISSANLKSSILSSSVKSIVYDQANHLIKLEDESGNVIDTLDATPFLSDGSGVTEVDYSDDLEDGNNYIVPSTFVVTPAQGSYVTTNLIHVEPGYHVIFTGDRNGGVPFIVGYDSTQQNPRELLGDTLLGSGTSNEEVRVRNYDLTIPSGVNYIRCCARGEGRDGAPKMVVKVRNTNNATGSVTIQSEAMELAEKVFVPEGKKIMLLGASFAGANNGWDKILQDTTGIEVINNAHGGTYIYRYVVPRLLDAGIAKPHGSLFMKDGKDIFDDIGAVIIMYTHNDVVLLEEEDYKTRTASWYRSNYEVGFVNGDPRAYVKNTTNEIYPASAWDYVIKQLKEWSDEHTNIEDEITASGKTANRQNDLVDNQLQILILSHWLPSRNIYNESSRKLAERHGVAYCPLDTELGFTKDDTVHGTFQTDQNNRVATEGDYNRSILHSEFVGVSTSGNRNVPTGRTEKKSKSIDTVGNEQNADLLKDSNGNSVIWGWHPQTLSSTIDYGYGQMTARNGSKMYVPWVQLAIAAAVRSCIEAKTEYVVETGESDPEKDGDYSEWHLTNHYFDANSYVPSVSSSGKFYMTDYIPVNVGDTITFTGYNNGPANGKYIPFIMGYSDTEGNGKTVVLEGSKTVNDEVQEYVKDEIVTIEDENIKYIRCNSRIEGSNVMKVIITRASAVAKSEFFASGTGANSLVRKNTGSAADGSQSVAIGYRSTAKGDYSLAEGFNAYAGGMYSHAEGEETSAIGNHAHAEGYKTTANYLAAHAEGSNTQANGEYSHAEGKGTIAYRFDAHSEGFETKAYGGASHAEGWQTVAGVEEEEPGKPIRASHAEGWQTVASGKISHAEGNTTRASGVYSHSEGMLTEASGKISHAEGNTTRASGVYSHSEGMLTEASSHSSHAGGLSSIAAGAHSFVHGKNVETKNTGEAAFGNYNISNRYSQEGDEPDTLFSIGNGTSGNDRKNAFEVKSNGEIYIWIGTTRVNLQELLKTLTPSTNYGTQETNVVFPETEVETSDDYGYGYYEPIGDTDENDYVIVDIGTQSHCTGDNPDEMVYMVDEYNITRDIYTMLTTIWNNNKTPMLVAHLATHDIDITIPLRRNRNREFVGEEFVGGYRLNAIISYEMSKRDIYVSLDYYYYSEIGDDDEIIDDGGNGQDEGSSE